MGFERQSAAVTPRQAVVMAACTNLVGALWGTAVATTIASGLIDPRVASQEVLICALLGAIIWNLVTWRAGLPSSSSHALGGGLVEAAVAAARNWSVVIWSQPDVKHWYPNKGLLCRRLATSAGLFKLSMNMAPLPSPSRGFQSLPQISIAQNRP